MQYVQLRQPCTKLIYELPCAVGRVVVNYEHVGRGSEAEDLLDQPSDVLSLVVGGDNNQRSHKSLHSLRHRHAQWRPASCASPSWRCAQKWWHRLYAAVRRDVTTYGRTGIQSGIHSGCKAACSSQ